MTAQSLLPWGEGRQQPEGFDESDNRRVIIVAGQDPYLEWKPTLPSVGDDVCLRRDATNDRGRPP
jgi:hypothetical protein